MAQLLVPNKQIVEEKLRQQKIKEVEENRKELEKKGMATFTGEKSRKNEPKD